jgi:hypothetical protein
VLFVHNEQAGRHRQARVRLGMYARGCTHDGSFDKLGCRGASSSGGPGKAAAVYGDIKVAKYNDLDNLVPFIVEVRRRIDLGTCGLPQHSARHSLHAQDVGDGRDSGGCCVFGIVLHFYPLILLSPLLLSPVPSAGADSPRGRCRLRC